MSKGPLQDRDRVINRFTLDAGTVEALDAYAALLIRWQQKINLVGPATLRELWRRHLWDSLQLGNLLPKTADLLADLGSGAGLPGLILAATRPVRVASVESDGRKMAFQRQAVSTLSVTEKVVLHNNRAEALEPLSADVITARAFAPLHKLLTLGYRHAHPNTVWILPKGQNVEMETVEATKYWTFRMEIMHSETQEGARILCLYEVKPR